MKNHQSVDEGLVNPVVIRDKGRAWLVVLLVMGLFTFHETVGQILNIDRKSPDSIPSKRTTIVASLRASVDRQNRDLIHTSTAVDCAYLLRDSLVSVLKFSTNLTTNGSDIIQNSGFVHLRVRDDDHRKYFPEVFLQWQWDGILGMQRRILAGSNLRCMVHKSSKFDVFVGLGAMYETELWTYDAVSSIEDPDDYPDVTTSKVRINQYVKTAFPITKRLDMVLANFIQSPVGNPDKPRISTSVAVNYRLIHWLSLGLFYDGIYDFAPVVPIDNYYYSLSTRLNINF